GLLLFSNDPAWAARVLDPDSGPDKTYHVQVDAIPDQTLLQALRTGVDADGEHLRAVSASVLRTGTRMPGWRSCWTKAATARSGGCWPPSTCRCCAWCAWPSARCSWVISARASGACCSRPNAMHSHCLPTTPRAHPYRDACAGSAAAPVAAWVGG